MFSYHFFFFVKGKVPTWNAKSNGVYVLKMDKGDVYGCPGGWGRKTVVGICHTVRKLLLPLSQMTSFRLFQTERVCR